MMHYKINNYFLILVHINLFLRVLRANMCKANPLFHNVKGAPFEIGDKVLVLDNPNIDETFNPVFGLRRGLIVYFEYSCGCGQNFPEDPMIGIEFEDGRTEEFWKEELKFLSQTRL
jgi:hypothetical protein